MHPPALPFSHPRTRSGNSSLLFSSLMHAFSSLPSQVFKACGCLTLCAFPCVCELGRKWQDGQASEKAWMYNVCVLAPDSACQGFFLLLLLSVCSWIRSNTTPSLPFLKLDSYLRLSLTCGSSSFSRLVAVPRQIMIAVAITLLACFFSHDYYEPLKGGHMKLARPVCYRPTAQKP